MSFDKKTTDRSTAEINGVLKALDRVQAVIEFELDGTIIHANDNFLNAVGYTLSEIKGNHHKIFCEEKYVNSNDYKMYWKQLAS